MQPGPELESNKFSIFAKDFLLVLSLFKDVQFSVLHVISNFRAESM